MIKPHPSLSRKRPGRILVEKKYDARFFKRAKNTRKLPKSREISCIRVEVEQHTKIT